MENLRRRVIYRQKQSSKGWRRYSVRMSTQRQYGESESKWYITSSKWGSNMYINAPETGRDSCEYYAYTDLNFINAVMLENANVNDLEMIQQLRHNPEKKTCESYFFWREEIITAWKKKSQKMCRKEKAHRHNHIHCFTCVETVFHNEGYDAFFQRSCLQKQEVLKSLQEILIYVYSWTSTPPRAVLP